MSLTQHAACLSSLIAVTYNAQFILRCSAATLSCEFTVSWSFISSPCLWPSIPLWLPHPYHQTQSSSNISLSWFAKKHWCPFNIYCYKDIINCTTSSNLPCLWWPETYRRGGENESTKLNPFQQTSHYNLYSEFIVWLHPVFTIVNDW